jgi:hypothetical protein
MKTFDLMLSEPIKYQSKGENTESSLLELSAPAANNRRKVAKLKQGFMRVVNEIPESAKQQAKEIVDKKEGDKKEETSPKEILALLQMGSIDYADYIDIFVGLLTSGICKVEGETPITSLMVDKISCEDLERLMGEYFVNFILGSVGE